MSTARGRFRAGAWREELPMAFASFAGRAALGPMARALPPLADNFAP